MLGSSVRLFILWAFTLCGAELCGQGVGFTLRTHGDFSTLSERMKEALPSGQNATVCLDLGGGATGSGVIVSPQGLVMSAAHVTQAVGKELTVRLADGRSYQAVGLGLDTSTDASLAQIIVPKEDGEVVLPYVELCEEVRTGQYVFSLGHAGGFNLERGSVLRLGRIMEITQDSLRTDCVLIGGDSGGPLFDLAGRLVGIHSRVGTVTNSNMHVPVSVFTAQWQELLDGKTMGDGTFAEAGLVFIGMQLLEVNEELKVLSVIPGSEAERLGFLVGDVLRGVNEIALKSTQDLVEVLLQLKPSSAGVGLELQSQRGEESRVVEFLFKGEEQE